MSRKLPALKPTQVIKALERAGFVVRRVKGSHHQLTHRSDPSLRTTVPYGTADIKRGTLHAILRDCAISNDEFIKLL